MHSYKTLHQIIVYVNTQIAPLQQDFSLYKSGVVILIGIAALIYCIFNEEY